MKRVVGKVKTFLRCTKVSVDQSRSGNNMITVEFRDNLNRLYKHFVSANQRSKIWLYNLFLGSGRMEDFDSLFLSITINENPFEYCIGRIYECIYVFDENFRWPVVNEIYSLEKPWYNKSICIQRYNEGWYKDILAAKTGTFKSIEDWPGKYYGRKEVEPNL